MEKVKVKRSQVWNRDGAKMVWFRCEDGLLAKVDAAVGKANDARAVRLGQVGKTTRTGVIVSALQLFLETMGKGEQLELPVKGAKRG